jgi:hypothetical protein
MSARGRLAEGGFTSVSGSNIPPGAELRTFSGTHAFDASVLIDTDADEYDTADQIVWDIEHGLCPRCESPLPTMFPAGSRITECCSIPICYRCGEDEVFEAFDAMAGIGWGGISGASCWPVSVEEIDERLQRHRQKMTLVTMILTGDGNVITEDGVTPLIIPRNQGGWAQHGDLEDGDQ